MGRCDLPPSFTCPPHSPASHIELDIRPVYWLRGDIASKPLTAHPRWLSGGRGAHASHHGERVRGLPARVQWGSAAGATGPGDERGEGSCNGWNGIEEYLWVLS